MRVISQCSFKIDADVKTGGQLRVAYKDVERFFDLGSRAVYDSSIHWAAFYSDCEHEVLPVTSGHRVTLTYQLYVSEHLSGLVHPQFPTADPKLNLLHQSIKEMLSSPTFMKNGGILGFHCAHQYAHTLCGTYNYPRRAHALKGIDVFLVTIFRTLGLTVHLEPVPEGDLSEDIFKHVRWFNERADHDVGMAYHEVAKPVTQWIGNESDIDWWYSLVALLVEVPVYSNRS
jgi:hypothetical protein